MSRIVTRGLGPQSRLITRGYGPSVARWVGRVLRRVSLVAQALWPRSAVGPTLACTSLVTPTLTLRAACDPPTTP